LELESVVGRGSTFHFEIPIALGSVGETGVSRSQTQEAIPADFPGESIPFPPLDAENTIATLPQAWKEQMHQAIIEADVATMQKLIHEIEAVFPDFGKRLAQLAYNFDYDGIRALIDAR
jgi:hypothetical protein